MRRTSERLDQQADLHAYLLKCLGAIIKSRIIDKPGKNYMSYFVNNMLSCKKIKLCIFGCLAPRRNFNNETLPVIMKYCNMKMRTSQMSLLNKKDK